MLKNTEVLAMLHVRFSRKKEREGGRERKKKETRETGREIYTSLERKQDLPWMNPGHPIPHFI